MKKSIFGNLNRNNATNRPKKLLDLSFDGTIALGTATQLSTKNFTKTLTGTTASGYTFPSALNPIFAANAGETVEIYAQMLTDTATDAANYNTINDITIQDVTLTGTNKTKELYLITKSRGTAVGTEDKPQCMLMMIRNASGTQAPEEIEPLHFVYYTKLPSNLATILEYPTANTTFHAEFDIKSGNWGGDPGIGDYRVTLTAVEDATGLRWRLQGDNAANGKDIVTGLTAYNNGAGGYWQEFSGYGEVVLGETIRIDFKITPPASNADVTTGETTVRITKLSDKSYVLLSKVGGVQKGIANLPLSRFMFILYNLGTPPGSAPYLDKPLTGIEIWDKPPYFLGWAEPIAVDTSLAGGTTQTRAGTDTLSIDFTSSTPEQVTIARNDNPAFAVWPDGANSGSFTAVTGGLDFALSLAHLNLGVNTIGVKANYSDYRKATDALSLTINAAVDPTPTAISVSMLSGLTQYQTGMDTLQISFTQGTPVSVDIVRNSETEFAGWPNGPILSDFTEVTGGINFNLNLAVLNLGNNSIGVTATYSDASTALAFLTLNILEVAPAPPPTPPSPLPAFPGAEGFGAASVGGRGGTVIKVTNTNDSGPGSFREALMAEYPRTIVFTVGGTIDLLSNIDVTGSSRSYLTVAGQTAPGGGIQTRYKTINFSDGVHDVIIRYLRHRFGWQDYDNTSGNNGPGLMFYSYAAPVYNIIVDHCSFAWAQDDTGFWNKVHDVTWQWSILAEAKNTLTGPSDLKGDNGKGLNAGAEPTEGANIYNVSLHHNFMAHNYSRTPAIAGDGPFEVVNNLVYNYGQFGMGTQNRGTGCRINIIGNYFKAGPDTNTNRYAITASGEVVGNHYEEANEMIYVLDNLTPQRTSGAQAQWDAVGYCGPTGTFCGVAATTAFQKATPWTVSSYPITVADAVDVPALVLADVGANAPARDATDTRIVSEYWAGIGSIHTHNDWPTLASGTVTVDTDTVANPHGIAANGYTNLENYINSVVP